MGRVVAIRRLRYNGGASRSRCRILRRAEVNRLCSLAPPPALVRYEHRRPGNLMYFDIKRLAHTIKPGHRIRCERTKESRGAGYRYLHIAIDEHSRSGFRGHPGRRTRRSAILFFLVARAYQHRFAISIRRMLTDNGSCCRRALYGQTLLHQHVEHCLIRPYTSRSNGKAERFIQTAIRK